MSFDAEEYKVLPAYFALLREAFDASEKADAFDVDSTDPESLVTWRELLKDETAANVELIWYIRENAEAIVEELGGSSKE